MRPTQVIPLLLVLITAVVATAWWFSGGLGGSSAADPALDGGASRVVEGPGNGDPGTLDGVEAAADRTARSAEEAAPASSVTSGPVRPAVAPPGGTIRGRAVDSRGRALVGARVLVAGEHASTPLDREFRGPFDFAPVHHGETDRNGEFTIEGPPAGLFHLAVRAPYFAPLDREDLALPEGAGGVDLGELVLQDSIVLEGVVVGPSGAPIPGAKLFRLEAGGSALIRDNQGVEVATTGPDGRFHIDELEAGPYRIRAHHPLHPSLIHSGVTEVPGDVRADLRLVLEEGRSIRGLVRGLPAGDRDDYEVVGTPGLEGTIRIGGEPPASSRISPSGDFELTGLPVDTDFTVYLAERPRRGRVRGFFDYGRPASESVVAASGDEGVLLAFQAEATLRFRVLDGETGLPVERFTAELGANWPMPLMDDDGQLLNEHPGGRVETSLVPGTAGAGSRLEIKAPGYQPWEQGSIRGESGAVVELGDVELVPVPTVRVTVLDKARGAPVEGARVSLSVETEVDGSGGTRMSISFTAGTGGMRTRLRSGEELSGLTDAEGVAVLNSIPGKRGWLQVEHPEFAPWKGETRAWPEGGTVHERVELDLGGSVLVSTVDAEGRAVPNARIDHEAPSQGGFGAAPRVPGQGGTRSDVEGQRLFERLASGSHRFRIHRGGDGMMRLGNAAIQIAGADPDADAWSSVEVVSGETAELTLLVPTTTRLFGVVTEEGQRLAGAELSLESAGTDVDPRAAALRSLGMGGGPQCRSSSDGTYEFTDVEPGDYRLKVEHTTRQMAETFEVTVGESEVEFDVDLSLTRIRGRVVDVEGEPIPGVQVEARRSRAAGSGAAPQTMMFMTRGPGGGTSMTLGGGPMADDRVLTDGDGRFELRGVASGVELGVHTTHGDFIPSASEPLRLEAGVLREGVDFELLSAGRAEILVQDAQGEPAAMRMVSATFVGGSEEPVEDKRGVSGEDGRCELSALHPGPWRISVTDISGFGSSAEPIVRDLVVESGEKAGLVVDLP